MSHLKYISITVLLCVMFVITAFAQNKNTTQKIYKNIKVEQLTATEASTFPTEKLAELTQNIYNKLQLTGRFDSVKLITGTTNNNSLNTSSAEQGESVSNEPQTVDWEKTETTNAEINGATLKISGEVTKYQKGSRTKRYLVGFGAGKTKIIANITFTDAETGEVVLKAVVDGDVVIGIFGGDSDGATNEIGGEIIKALKKNKLVGEKMKK